MLRPAVLRRLRSGDSGRSAILCGGSAVHDVDVPDHLAALATELAGEPVRVERPHDGDRLALVVEGDCPDPLAVCTNNSRF